MFKSTGRFLGTIEDAGLEITPVKDDGKGGLPVWVAYFKPHSKRENGEFVEIANEEVIRFSAFLYGYSGDPIFHCQNIVDATGWNGSNLQQLNTIDYSKVGDVQFSIGTETFTDKNDEEQMAYRVQWIQTPAYEPQVIRKATVGEIKDATQKFNRFKPAGTTKAAAKSSATPAKPTTPKAPPESKTEAKSESSEIHFNDPDTTWDELQKYIKEQGEVIDDDALGETWFNVIKANHEQNDWPKDVDQYSVDQLRTLYAGVIQELSLDVPF